MATYYSDHYSANVGSTGHFTTRTPGKVVPAGAKHGRMRKSQARVTVPNATVVASGEAIRLMDFKSGDRLFDIFFSMDADWGATATFDVGLYKKGENDDGAVIDADLFTSAIDWSGAIARESHWKEAGTLTDMDRGQPLWYLADKGAGTYTADPFEVWTLAVTATQLLSAAAAAVEMLCEVNYISGD